MRSVLVLRHYDEFSQTLANAGIPIINCPVIRTEPLDDLTHFEDLVGRLNDYSAIFITSAAAADILASRLKRSEYKGEIVILGHRSFDILKDKGIELIFDERVVNAVELFEAAAIDRFRGSRVLFIRGERSLRTIPERLSGIAEVDEAVVYRTVNIEIAEAMKDEIREKIETGSVSIACFFSPSGVDSFDDQFGAEVLGAVRIAAIGQTTAKALRDRGLEVDVVASNPEGSLFAADVLKYLGVPVEV
jgi:uroporphyrinogen-III synthase